MAHFAELNDNDIVVRVIVVRNQDCGEPDLTFPETCEKGQRFIADVLNLSGSWKQTSYNSNFRGKYAAIGDQWDGNNFVSVEVAE